jgi:hypothetical protein
MGEPAMALTTYAVLLLGCAAGTGFGLVRLKVWAVVPSSLVFMLVAVTFGAYSHLAWSRIALIIFCVLTTFQISYLIGSALSEAPQAQRIPDRIPERQELLHAAQTAIGEELRAYFLPSPLNDMPSELLNRLALLEGR